VADPTLSSVSAPDSGAARDGSPAAARSIILSVRLRTRNGGGFASDVSWAGESPAVALSLDLLSASGGAAEPPHGLVLSARFVHFQSALLTARRLQWALQGLAESAGSNPTAAVIAIHAVDDPASAGMATALERVSPSADLVGSSILLCGGIAGAVQQLPGVLLRETGDANWCELVWKGAEAPSSFSADEQSVLGLIRALGREDPCPSPPEARIAIPVANRVTAPVEAPAVLEQSRADDEPGSAWAKFKWLIVGGAAAALVLVVMLVISMGSHSKAPVQNSDPSKTAGPVAPANPTPNPPAPPVSEKPHEAKPSPKSTKQARNAQPDSQLKAEPPAQKPVTGPCDLTEAEIPRSLTRAENLMYAGKLEEAQAAYQRVLGCPSAHEQAAQGLQRVKQRMAAQSP